MKINNKKFHKLILEFWISGLNSQNFSYTQYGVYENMGKYYIVNEDAIVDISKYFEVELQKDIKERNLKNLITLENYSILIHENIEKIFKQSNITEETLKIKNKSCIYNFNSYSVNELVFTFDKHIYCEKRKMVAILNVLGNLNPDSPFEIRWGVVDPYKYIYIFVGGELLAAIKGL